MASKREGDGRRSFPVLIAFILAVLVLIWIVGLADSLNERRLALGKAEEDALRMSQLVAEQTGSLLREVKIYLKLMDVWLVDNPAADPRTDASFLHLVDNLRSQARFRIDLRLVSKDDGLFYIPSTDLSRPLSYVGDREYVRAQKDPATRGFFIAAPVLSRVTGVWGIPVSYPLTSRNAGMAVIFAAIELPFLNELYEAVRPKPDGAIMLTRKDGTILTRAPFDEEGMGLVLAGQKSWEERREGVQTSVSPIDGEERIIAFRTIPGLSLEVSVALSKRDTLTRWARNFYARVGILTAATLLTLLLGWQLLVNWRSLMASKVDVQSLNKELHLKVEAINDQLAEKEAIVRETNHRVKNHMSQLIALIELGQNTGSREEFDKLKARVFSYCVLYEKLSYQAEGAEIMKVSEYLRDLMSQLVTVSPSDRPVVFEINDDPATAPARTCSTLGLILCELVTNAIKHAECDEPVLRLYVTIGEEEGRLHLAFSDNGKGFDYAAARKQRAEGHHLGMILIDTMLAQHQGNLAYDRDRGSRFDIVI